ncbi:VIT family protein [Neisseriaceae bacterium ESL0693]|nr:VIT family protein [Neisseriaceae bacterium ESL0693]
MQYSWHNEPHFSQRNNWLRACVLGANDGLISTASLLMGLSAAMLHTQTLLLTGIAALVSGAASMAAGEYVSVSSQSDTEAADLRHEKYLLDKYPDTELQELIDIYRQRGLNKKLAGQVAKALTEHNALATHAREEIGITQTNQPDPLQAALASAISFSCGAIVPVLTALFSPVNWLMPILGLSTLTGLALLGWLSARLGGAPAIPAIRRILILGTLALLLTSGAGYLMNQF